MCLFERKETIPAMNSISYRLAIGQNGNDRF